MIDLKELQKQIYQNKVDKKFNLTNIPQEFCYLHGEVSEAFEAWLKKKDSTEIAHELADVAIFTLGLAEMLNINLEEALLDKIAINKKRIYVNGKKIDTTK